MLERLVEQRKAITASNVELDNPVELHASHWAIAEKVVKALQVYEEATHEASDNYSSAAIVIPIVLSLNVCPESHLESNGCGTALTLDLNTLTNN